MAKQAYKTTEKTPRFWRGRPTPAVGTVVYFDPKEVKYEVSLGILEPAPSAEPEPGKPAPAPVVKKVRVEKETPAA
jgi:hypothetical protein